LFDTFLEELRQSSQFLPLKDNREATQTLADRLAYLVRRESMLSFYFTGL
jgi:hypothetical protein